LDETPGVAIAQRVQQRRQHPRAAGADGVTERDRTAMHIDPIPIPLQLLAIGERLRREGFVGFDEIVVTDRAALLAHEIAHRGHRREEQILRRDGTRRIGGDPRHDREPLLAGVRFGRHDQRGGAVVERRGVAGGDTEITGLHVLGSITRKRGLEFGQALE